MVSKNIQAYFRLGDKMFKIRKQRTKTSAKYQRSKEETVSRDSANQEHE